MDLETKAFYDGYWPRNVPIVDETRRYVLETVEERGLDRVLDAGCGPGTCTVPLSEISRSVVALDISTDSLGTAREQARLAGRSNIEFVHQDLQELDFADESFDLVWCWGVAMMAPDPIRVIDHLCRVLRNGGTLYLGVYLKTWLSPVHQGLRHLFRTFMNGPRRRKLVADSFAGLTWLVCKVRGEEINRRPDNINIQAQVEDWFYPPFKTFFSVDEILGLLRERGVDAVCIQPRLARMKSATIFVVRGVKELEASEGR